MQQFKVDGMGCNSCSNKIIEAVKKRDDQANISVDRPAGLVSIESRITTDQLCQLITHLGFDVTALPPHSSS